MRCKMRSLSFVLAVLVVVVPVLADPGGGTKIGFDSGRQQVSMAMNQAPEDQTAQPGVEIEGKLVPGKALLLSAILPGAGQYYAKSPFWAAAFLAIEIGAWAGVAVNHGEGMDKEDEYLAYADAHWIYGEPDVGEIFESYFAYEYWCASFFGSNGISGSGDDEYEGSQTLWEGLTWAQKRDYLPTNGFTHEIDPTDRDQQYYEMIGKYGQFATGWEDYNEAYHEAYPPEGQPWQTSSSITPMRDNYLTIRKDSNDALDMSKNFTMVVLANHLISALHAGFTVTKKNKRLAQEQTIEGAFNVAPKRYNNETIAMGVLSIKF